MQTLFSSAKKGRPTKLKLYQPTAADIDVLEGISNPVPRGGWLLMEDTGDTILDPMMGSGTCKSNE